MSSRLKIELVVLGVLIIVAFVLYFYSRPSGEASTLTSTDRISLFVYPKKTPANGIDKAKIIATFRRKQNPLSGVNVFFSTSVGTLSNQEMVTDSDGEAVTYLTSNIIGEATVTVNAGEATKDIQVEFVGAR